MKQDVIFKVDVKRNEPFYTPPDVSVKFFSRSSVLRKFGSVNMSGNLNSSTFHLKINGFVVLFCCR